MVMHTRHWIFGIGLPILGAVQAALMGQATGNEAAAAQASTAQFSVWIAMAVQLAIGVADWIKNNNKPPVVEPGTTTVTTTAPVTTTTTAPE